MKTVQVRVYKFNELDKKIQETLIEKSRYDLFAYDWYLDFYEDFIIEAKEAGFEFDIKNIFFSGFHSQGDGACFDCDNIDVSKFVKDTRLLKYLDYVKFYTQKNNYATHYCHSKTRYIDFSNDYQYDDKFNKIIEKIIEKLQHYIYTAYLALCSSLYSKLDKKYSYLTSDECIKNDLIDLNLDYLYNGTKFY